MSFLPVDGSEREGGGFKDAYVKHQWLLGGLFIIA